MADSSRVLCELEFGWACGLGIVSSPSGRVGSLVSSLGSFSIVYALSIHELMFDSQGVGWEYLDYKR
jgi:hypothetical protein